MNRLKVRNEIAMNSKNSITSNYAFLNQYKKYSFPRTAPIYVIVAEDSIISTPLTPLWHRGVRGEYTEIIKEGANIDKLIRRAMQGMGADLKNPRVEQLWKAHKDVYTDLGRECWAKAIHKQYFESRGITY